MGFFDEAAAADVGEATSLGSDYQNLPAGMWVLGGVIRENEKLKPSLAVFEGDRGEYTKLELVLRPIGGEISRGTYNSVFLRLPVGGYVKEGQENTPIAVGDPGFGKYKTYGEWAKETPSSRLMGLACALVCQGQGLEIKDQAERSIHRKSHVLGVLGAMATQHGLNKANGQAENFAEALAFWLQENPAKLLIKTKLRKGRKYTDSATGEAKVSQDQIAVSSFEDDTPGNRGNRGVVDWFEETEAPTF